MSFSFRSRSNFPVLLTILASAGLTGALPAAVTVYTAYSEFVSGLSSLKTETFDALPLGFNSDAPINFTTGSYSYWASSPRGLYTVGSVADVWLSNNFALEPLLLSFSPSSVTAVGGNFFATDFDGLAASGSVTVATDDGSVVTVFDTQKDSFVGFVSTSRILSLSVTADNAPPRAFMWPTANNLVFGEVAPPWSVPEGGPSLVNVMLAVVGVAGLSRLKRR